MMKEPWYQNSWRRNLVDMHIHDWDDVFLSEFSPEDYLENLKKAHIKSAMIYTQSHVGYCYYPTKCGVMHRAFVGKEDMMRRLVELCHQNDIDVILYYSPLYNTVEEERHPEWRVIDGADSDTSSRQRGGRYGHCCPNNLEYRAFVEEQIHEISEYFEAEGMFYDMTYWSGICRCPSCTERFRKESGIEKIPRTVDWNDPVWRIFQQKRYDWISEFAAFVTSTSKKYMPNATVEHNYAYGVTGDWRQGSCEGVADACDYCGADLYGDIYNHTFTAKYFRNISRDQPFEYMTSRFAVDLKQHTMTKSLEKLTQEILLNAAHHGASFIIDAMDPVGTVDTRVYDKLRAAFERQMLYEPYLKGTPIEDVAVYYAVTGRYNTVGQVIDSRSASSAMLKKLIRVHIPVGVISGRTVGRAKNYRLVFAPAVAGLSEDERKGLFSYVREGGTLYFSGAEEPVLLREFFGAELMGYTDEQCMYTAPTAKYKAFFCDFDEKYPIATPYRLPVLGDLKDSAEVMAHQMFPYGCSTDRDRWASIHSNPPGVLGDAPAFVKASYGKGCVYWSAAPLEYEDNARVPEIFAHLVDSVIAPEERTLCSDAPARVELLAYRDGADVLIHAVDLLYGDDPIKLYPFHITLRCNKRPERVVLLPDHAELPFSWSDGKVTFESRALSVFDTYRIEVKER